jgi:hypothetical protein
MEQSPKIIYGEVKSGLIYCEIQDMNYPYNTALAYGKTLQEAEKNAWKLRKNILKEQLKIKPTIINYY